MISFRHYFLSLWGHQATWRGFYSRNGQTSSSLTGRTSGLPIELINEAYQVLGNSQARANYDARSYGPPEEGSPRVAHQPDPVVCSSRQGATAQPRYVIYRNVVSVIFATWRAVQQGIFCAECGAKRAYRASGKTWLLVWWGIPWGPVYSVHAIYSNMFGGERPPLTTSGFAVGKRCTLRRPAGLIWHVRSLAMP